MMSIVSQCLIPSFKRLCLSSYSSNRCLSTATSPLMIKMTQVVWSEPLKKKKRIDPQVLRRKFERKKRKLYKSIKIMGKSAKQLKPLDEVFVSFTLRQEKDMRKRIVPAISGREEKYRIDLLKRWCNYKHQQSIGDAIILRNLQASMNEALEELYNESEDLWLEAIQLDHFLLPFRAKGPVQTPPIKNFDSPDGEYINETEEFK